MSNFALTLARPTLADRIFARSAVTDLALIAAGTALTALSAQLIIPMYPVPFTMQTFVVLIVGSTLGTTRGTLSMLLYAVLGLVGLPIFGGASSGCCRAVRRIRRLHHRLHLRRRAHRMAGSVELGQEVPRRRRLVRRRRRRDLRVRPHGPVHVVAPRPAGHPGRRAVPVRHHGSPQGGPGHGVDPEHLEAREAGSTASASSAVGCAQCARS